MGASVVVSFLERKDNGSDGKDQDQGRDNVHEDVGGRRVRTLVHLANQIPAGGVVHIAIHEKQKIGEATARDKDVRKLQERGNLRVFAFGNPAASNFIKLFRFLRIWHDHHLDSVPGSE